MKPGLTLFLILTGVIVIGTLAVPGISPRGQGGIPVYRYEVVHAYPHDRFAFTEGLAWADGTLVESTGLEGNSSLRQVNLTTGAVIRIRNLSPEYFGEGVAVYGDRIAQLTEDSGFGIIYNRTTMEPAGIFNYTTEGWGLAWNGRELIMSDGSSSLYFIDPATFRVVRRIVVQAEGAPVESLNELEYAEGAIYANIWPTERIARIDPQTGNVTGWIELDGLLSPQEKNLIGWAAIDRLRGRTAVPFAEEACPNGIAYDPDGNRLFVTGKLWPELFEIRIIPA